MKTYTYAFWIKNYSRAACTARKLEFYVLEDFSREADSEKLRVINFIFWNRNSSRVAFTAEKVRLETFFLQQLSESIEVFRLADCSDLLLEFFLCLI